MKFLVQMTVDVEVSVEAEDEAGARDAAENVVQGCHELMVSQVQIVAIDEDGE